MAVYADTWLIYTGLDYAGMVSRSLPIGNGTPSYAWPVYLTNWTYTTLCLYLTLHALTAIVFLCHRSVSFCRRMSRGQHRALFKELEVYPSLWGDSYEPVPPHDNDELEFGETVTRNHLVPLYFKVVWILYNIVSSCSIMVTMIFFVFLWPQFDDNAIDVDNLQLHGINSVIVFLELVFTALPVHFLHFLYAFLYGLVYISFTAIFYGAGNMDPIYPKVLDWNADNVGATMLMVVLVGFVIIPGLQIIFFLVYKLKIWIYDRVSSMTTN